MRASKLQPALLGGLVIGVLSALPVISMGNCLCCAWVILGGMTATYLLQQAQPGPVEAADGAIAGLLAGLFGAVVGSLVSIPIQMLMGPMNGDLLRRILEQGGSDMPGEMRTTIESLTRGGGVGGALMIVGFVTSLFVNAIFGAIGGLLGTLIFKPSIPPPPPPVPGFADPARPHGPEL